MKFDYIEIGSCNFDTLDETRQDKSFRIEPFDFLKKNLKYMFTEDGGFRINLMNLETTKGFIDCHRPNYSQNEKTILHIKM